MRRNLDLTALRSFVAVVETGGVTRAAGQLNLTQSAVSMQLKRLEVALGQKLFDRVGRTVVMTGQGELLLSYARRMMSLNDEVWDRMTGVTYEGDLKFGVPHDIVYPHIPHVLKTFAAGYPRVKVHLISSFTSELKQKFSVGELDLILTTEEGVDAGAEVLSSVDLVWYGAQNGTAWKSDPLRLAYEKKCIFRLLTQKALDKAGRDWEMAVETDSSMTVEASLSADLAVHARLKGSAAGYLEEINHGGTLPDLPKFHINMQIASENYAPLASILAECVRDAYLGQRSQVAA